MRLVSFAAIGNRLFLGRWLSSTQGLIRVRNRLKREIPSTYRRGFQKAWVESHLGARRRQAKTSDAVVPLTIKISPTMRCNLHCLGCFAAAAPSGSDLGLGLLSRLVGEARALGTPSIGVIGGEPLLVPGLFDVFDANRDMGFYLVTNGTKVDGAVCERLRTLPNVITVISVDGFAETNDANRGRGVYEQILAAMCRLKEAHVCFGFSTVVHRQNRKEVVSARFLDEMIGQGCLMGAFLPYIPVGNAPRHDIVCSPQEVKDYYAELDTLARSRAILILKEGYSDGTFLNSGCAAAETMHITGNGDAEPCNGIEFSTANVRSHGISEILESPFFQAIRDLHPERTRRCLVVTDPEGVLRVVNQCGALPTHAGALERLEAYARDFRIAVAASDINLDC